MNITDSLTLTRLLCATSPIHFIAILQVETGTIVAQNRIFVIIHEPFAVERQRSHLQTRILMYFYQKVNL